MQQHQKQQKHEQNEQKRKQKKQKEHAGGEWSEERKIDSVSCLLAAKATNENSDERTNE